MSQADEGNARPSFLGPHNDRELELMRAGKKHLSSFSEEVGIERETFPEREFDLHVAEGRFVKDVRIVQYLSADGEETSMRIVLYATCNEVWRIPAMRMIDLKVPIRTSLWSGTGMVVVVPSSDRCITI